MNGTIPILADIAGTISNIPGAYDVLSTTARLLSDGKPLAIAHLTDELGWSLERVDTILACFPDVERDEAGNLVGFGLTLHETPHSYQVDGKRLFTWCALDALFFPVILGQSACVTSRCRATGVPIRMAVSPTGVADIEPSSTVVSLVTACEANELRGAFCNAVNFFASAEDARTWLSEQCSGQVLSVERAFILAKDCAAAMRAA
ncbi:organomercurial lyase MerB [Pendulispora brunnea]|uniref:Alkylmercury lyase n=1 Tax=Pendulispora brunnea TaxID=2905690 RepID=A0ABZ2KD49_9BACT